MTLDQLSPLAIYVVDDLPGVYTDMAADLAQFGLPMRHWATCEQCLHELDWDACGVIFIDHEIKPVSERMQGDVLLQRLMAWRSSLVVVMYSGRPLTPKELAAVVFRLGSTSQGYCVDYLNKPVYTEELLASTTKALSPARPWAAAKARQRRMIQALLDRISPAELFVMEGVLQGLTSKQIAEVCWEVEQKSPSKPRRPKRQSAPKRPGWAQMPPWLQGLPLPPSDDSESDRDLEGAEPANGTPPVSKEYFLRSREAVISLHRNNVNNREDRLKPLGLRIADFSTLLQVPGMTSLHSVLSADIALRLELLDPAQRQALEAALTSGEEEVPSAALNAALARLRAPDLAAFNKWRRKLAYLEARQWAWLDLAPPALSA